MITPSILADPIVAKAGGAHYATVGLNHFLQFRGAKH
jgi:hypothetical protein